jgi:hypothetical protein
MQYLEFCHERSAIMLRTGNEAGFVPGQKLASIRPWGRGSRMRESRDSYRMMLIGATNPKVPSNSIQWPPLAECEVIDPK